MKSAGPDEEHERQRDLQRDQRAAGDEPGRRRCRRPATAAEREPGTRPGVARAAPAACRTRARRSGTCPIEKAEHPRAQAERQLNRRPRPVERRQQAASDDEGEHDAGGRAQRREDDALGEQLAHQPAPGPAPSARRIAISRWRAAVRISSRPATLAQAMHSTAAMIAVSRYSGRA